MPSYSEDGESRTIEAWGLRLRFQWLGHSWTHSIEYQGIEWPTPRVLAIALEGDPERDDPARVVSPTYQQIHFQGEGPELQALLVGQSGPHHFSAVFTFDERSGGDASIDVDVADRCQGLVEKLAATYTVDARSDALVDADQFGAAWDYEPGRLTFAVVSPGQFTLAEAGRRATQIQAIAEPDSKSATRRLRYQWHWQTVPFEEGCLPGRE
jgi:hypothetical protein